MKSFREGKLKPQSAESQLIQVSYAQPGKEVRRNLGNSLTASSRLLILLPARLAAQPALAEPSLAEKNATENAAIKKEWESWNAPFQACRLLGNIHDVGASGISSSLITTP
jgi:hypothetical protein